MGTNYFAIHDSCGECGRFDQTQICKSLIMFRGQFTWDSDGDPEPWLTSWADWKTFLTSGRVDYIVDEYGNQHDITGFIARVEATDKQARRRQFDAVRGWPHRKSGVAPGGDWLDADGFSFYGAEFS